MQLACTFGPNHRFAKTTGARIFDAKEGAAERAAPEAKKRGTSGDFSSRRPPGNGLPGERSRARLDFFLISYPNSLHE